MDLDDWCDRDDGYLLICGIHPDLQSGATE